MVLLEEPIKGVLTLRNYVNGEWVEPSSGAYRDVVNPATLKKIAKVPFSDAGDTEAAVEAAQGAFPAWRRTPPLTRARYLLRLKELLEGHFGD